MKISDERLAEFNDRMNDWISKQGLVFQLTHGGTGLGGNPPIVGSIIRTILSIVLLLLLAALGYSGFLFWKASGKELPKQLRKGIASGFGVEEVIASGFKRDFSSGKYKEIIAKGNQETFFNHLAARKLDFSMEPLDGLFGTWETQAINIEEAQIALKAGAPDSEQASKSWQSIFHQRPDFSFQTLTVKKASLSWGYTSSATWGSIVDSQLTASRTSEGWNLIFKGGKFSQGIFRDFKIVKLEVELDPEKGLSIPEAEMKADEGTFTWSGKMLTGGASPTFEAQGQLTRIPLAKFLPPALLKVVNGNIDATFTATGSTNNEDGICFTLHGKPESENGIFLTKELNLLRMLSHLDAKRSYRKIPYNLGSFILETKGNTLDFKDLSLTSQDIESKFILSKIKGNFRARASTKEDLQEETLALQIASNNASETIGSSPLQEQKSAKDFEKEILNVFEKLQFKNPHMEISYFEKTSSAEKFGTPHNIKNREEKKQIIGRTHLSLTPRRLARSPFLLEGEVQLAIPHVAFKEIPSLPNLSPIEPGSHLQWVQIPLNSLVLRSTDQLTIKWEEAMEELGNDN